MLMQATAMLRDAYRELNAKRLFWIVLALSGLVVLAFAIVGVTPKGLSILWWEIPLPMINSIMFPKEFFYKQMFLTLGIGFWLSWIAMILALISVSSMIPDLVAGGSIELTLSRPISRTRLFLLKYASGLLFVALQVSVFAVASFLVIGLRSGAWEPRILLSVPLVIVVFSFIYCICALLGLVTRSAMASMLITLLIWFGIFAINTAEKTFLMVRESNAMALEQREAALGRYTRSVRLSQAASTGVAPADDALPPLDRASLNPAQKSNLERIETRLEETKANGRTVRRVHRVLVSLLTVLPKTADTTQLLERALISDEDRERLVNARTDDEFDSAQSEGDDVRIDPARIGQRVEQQLRGRSAYWIVGTSLAFEAVILGICCWIFARRDF